MQGLCIPFFLYTDIFKSWFLAYFEVAAMFLVLKIGKIALENLKEKEHGQLENQEFEAILSEIF